MWRFHVFSCWLVFIEEEHILLKLRTTFLESHHGSLFSLPQDIYTHITFLRSSITEESEEYIEGVFAELEVFSEIFFTQYFRHVAVGS